MDSTIRILSEKPNWLTNEEIKTSFQYIVSLLDNTELERREALRKELELLCKS